MMEPPFVKQRQSLLYREECSPDVQPNDFVEMLLSHLADGGELTTTRAGEKNINLAFLLPDCFVKAIEIIEISGIAQNPGDILADLLYRLIESGLVPTSDEGVCALLNEELGRGQCHP